MIRDEHLSWARVRARGYLVDTPDLGAALASFISDLQKHPWWTDTDWLAIAAAEGAMLAMAGDGPAFEHWLDGFN